MRQGDTAMQPCDRHLARNLAFAPRNCSANYNLSVSDTSRRQRLVLIEMERANAMRVLSAANHDTMKAHARDSLRDLDEAERWLGKRDIDTRPFILAIVDAAIHLAILRMAIVGKALKDFGPDAMEIG